MFFLKGEATPFCVSCDEPLSLEHICCSVLTDIRREKKYFKVASLKVLFEELSSDIIFNFLKEINVFYKFKFVGKKYIYLFLIIHSLFYKQNSEYCRGTEDWVGAIEVSIVVVIIIIIIIIIVIFIVVSSSSSSSSSWT